jgi:hypothetical protein
MAYQGYRHKTDKTVGNHAPVESVKAGGKNKTPAPLTQLTVNLGRDTAWGASNGGPQDNSGKNRYGGPSSVDPGMKGGEPNIRAMPDTDLVLDAVLKGGAHGAQVSDDWQTRDIGMEQADPTTFGMRNRSNEGAKVPAKTGTPEFDPNSIRKP